MEKVYKCVYCDFEMINSKGALVSHMWNKHQDRPELTNFRAAYDLVNAASYPVVIRNVNNGSGGGGGSGSDSSVTVTTIETLNQSSQTQQGKGIKRKRVEDKVDEEEDDMKETLSSSSSSSSASSSAVSGGARPKGGKRRLFDIAATGVGISSSVELLPLGSKALPFSCQVPGCDQVGINFPGVTESDRRAAGEAHITSKHQAYVDSFKKDGGRVCTSCGKGFEGERASLCFFTQHKRLHDSRVWKVCEFCPYSSDYNSSVTKHTLRCSHNTSAT